MPAHLGCGLQRRPVDRNSRGLCDVIAALGLVGQRLDVLFGEFVSPSCSHCLVSLCCPSGTLEVFAKGCAGDLADRALLLLSNVLERFGKVGIDTDLHPGRGTCVTQRWSAHSHALGFGEVVSALGLCREGIDGLLRQLGTASGSQSRHLWPPRTGPCTCRVAPRKPHAHTRHTITSV